MSLNVIELRTPSFVLSEMETNDKLLRSLISDVSASNAGTDEFRKGLKALGEEWAKFYNDHAKGIGGWFSRGTSPVYDKTRDYHNRILGFQHGFQQAGGKVSLPGTAPQSKRTVPPWAVLGVAGVAAYAFFHYKHKTERRQGDLYTRQVRFDARS